MAVADAVHLPTRLAVGRAGGGFTDLSPAGRDETADRIEGTILQRVGGTWHLLASDGDARRYRVYDLALADEGQTRWQLLTLDGTQSAEPVLGNGGHGDFLVMQAQTTPGYEFPPRIP